MRSSGLFVSVLTLFCGNLVVLAEIDHRVGSLRQSLLNLSEENDSLEGNSLEYQELPDNIRKEFPYYVTGFDRQNRLVLAIELGRWKWEPIAERGGTELDNLEKHINLIYNRIEHWATKHNGVVIIFDFEDFGFKRIPSNQAKAVLVRIVQRLAGLLEEKITYGFCVNVNHLAGIYINLAKPFLGKLTSKFEFYGTHSDQWIPRLQTMISPTQLPPWYGGVKNFKPVAIYGR